MSETIVKSTFPLKYTHKTTKHINMLTQIRLFFITIQHIVESSTLELEHHKFS